MKRGTLLSLLPAFCGILSVVYGKPAPSYDVGEASASFEEAPLADQVGEDGQIAQMRFERHLALETPHGIPAAAAPPSSGIGSPVVGTSFTSTVKQVLPEGNPSDNEISSDTNTFVKEDLQYKEASSKLNSFVELAPTPNREFLELDKSPISVRYPMTTTTTTNLQETAQSKDAPSSGNAQVIDAVKDGAGGDSRSASLQAGIASDAEAKENNKEINKGLRSDDVGGIAEKKIEDKDTMMNDISFFSKMMKMKDIVEDMNNVDKVTTQKKDESRQFSRVPPTPQPLSTILSQHGIKINTHGGNGITWKKKTTQINKDIINPFNIFLGPKLYVHSPPPFLPGPEPPVSPFQVMPFDPFRLERFSPPLFSFAHYTANPKYTSKYHHSKTSRNHHKSQELSHLPHESSLMLSLLRDAFGPRSNIGSGLNGLINRVIADATAQFHSPPDTIIEMGIFDVTEPKGERKNSDHFPKSEMGLMPFQDSGVKFFSLPKSTNKMAPPRSDLLVMNGDFQSKLIPLQHLSPNFPARFLRGDPLGF